jgi:hypothetical protein
MPEHDVMEVREPLVRCRCGKWLGSRDEHLVHVGIAKARKALEEGTGGGRMSEPGDAPTSPAPVNPCLEEPT